MIWQEIKEIYNYGIKDYLRSWNNIVNSAMNILYFAAFGLKYYTMLIVRLNINKLNSEAFWREIVSVNETELDKQIDIYQTFYWLNNGRKRKYSIKKTLNKIFF
jgi:hypothetical protein